MKVVLASQNKKKIVEMREILSKMGVEVLSQAEAGVNLEPEETGTTFEENSRIKAKAVMEATGLPAIADDSGLMVDALGGEPGVYSARYGGEGLDDTGRWQLLLKNMVGRPTGPASLSASSAAASPTALRSWPGESAPASWPRAPAGTGDLAMTPFSICPNWARPWRS